MPRKGDKAVHVWLSARAVKMIDYLAVDWEMNRTEALRRLVEEALTRYDPLAERNGLLGQPIAEGAGDERSATTHCP